MREEEVERGGNERHNSMKGLTEDGGSDESETIYEEEKVWKISQGLESGPEREEKGGEMRERERKVNVSLIQLVY